LYSPQTRRYSAAIETRPLGGDRAVGGDAKHAPPQQAPISWSGIPEASFGGMYRPGGLELGRPEYRFSADGTSIEDLPVSIWSTKSLTARWQFDDDALVESKLESPGLSQLFGTFTHHLPVPIEDWIVAYGNRVFRPRGEVNPAFEKIRPGELWNPSAASVHQRELRGFLTRAKVYKVAKKEGFGEDILIRQDPYDPLDLDPTDLLRLLTFHAAAGGSNYTGLENTALSQFDLSPLLQLDRAVLFGRIKMSVAVPRIDGEAVEPTQQVAFVRILLPVKRVESGPRILPDLGDEVIKLQHLKREEAEKKLKKDEK
jgi:hypothetical protein